MTPLHLIRHAAKEILWKARVAVELSGIRHSAPILVYQMGKVGSSTVAAALKGEVSQPVIQVHILNAHNLAKGIRVTRASSEVFLPPHLIWSIGIVRNLRAGVFPCKIITLTRDPVARAISFMFETRARKLPRLTEYDADRAVRYACEAIVDVLSQENPHSDPTQWFETELRKVFGIDVFETPYDFPNGFSIIEHPIHPVLVIRLEDFSRSLGRALAAFLGVEYRSADIKPVNLGSEKAYATVYREVQRQLRLPESVLTRVYSTRYARHFYGSELSALMSRWGGSADA